MAERYLFKNASIFTQNPEAPFLTNSCLFVEDKKIAYIGENLKKTPEACTVIDASKLLLCPGLVNAHTHSPMTLLRGYRDDCSLDDWLSCIWPAEAALDADDYYWGAMLGIAEMLAYGTISISDMYRSSSSIFHAAIDSGIKANICESITCKPDENPKNSPAISESVSLIRYFQNYDHGRIRLDTSIQSVWQTTPQLWEYIASLAAEYHLGIHIHLCETAQEVETCRRIYGKTPISLLDSYGVFRNRIAAVHGIYVSTEEIDILKSQNATLVHDPCSNLKCCCGFVNLKPFIDREIPVALGTDGVCSNNSGDLFETIKFTSLIQKMLNDDPAFLPAEELFQMATLHGLHSQGRQGTSGILKPGMDADIIALDLSHPGLQPFFSPASSVVYSAHGNHVLLTMVRGKILYKQGEYTTIDMERVSYHIRKSLEKLPAFKKTFSI